MKDKFNRIMATGLIYLMITNFASCNNVGNINNLESGKDNNIITETQSSKDKFASGKIWNTLKNNKAMTHAEYPYDFDELEGRPIPINFLTNEGLLQYNHLNRLVLTTEKQPSLIYEPLLSRAFIDENSKENDIYLIVQFQNDEPIENSKNSNVYLATWQLKYTLNDDDYATFLKMQGDWRILLFIQEMDRQYTPEIISKTIISHDLLSVGSHVKTNDWDLRGFPYIFVTNVDYDNQIITFGAKSNEGIRYFSVDMRETDAWDLAVSRDGLTPDERENSINMYSKQTPLGKCLIKFEVNNIKASLTTEQAKEAFNTTSNISNLKEININTQEKTYNYNEIIK